MSASTAIRYRVVHRTSYDYDAVVHQSFHVLRLSPRTVDNQTVIRHRLFTEPRFDITASHTDFFGNPFSLLQIESDHKILVVTSESEIDVVPRSPIDLAATTDWRALTDDLAGTTEYAQKDESAAPGGAGVSVNIGQYRANSRHGRRLPQLAEYARVSFPDGQPILQGASDLTRRIFEDFTFDPTATDISTPVERVLELKRGVCQDFAHLQISALRSLGLPARYVSGYILTHPPAGQERLQGADASHAWVAVWAPETGWVDFDPTNNMIPHNEHITFAYGRDYDDVAPISGVLLGGGAHSVDVSVDVSPLNPN